MKFTITFLFRALSVALLLLLTTSQTSAQDSCTFRLRVYDQFGDGWDDSRVYIRLGNGAEQSYTHGGAAINAADSTRFFNIRVRSGDSLRIRYEAQGNFQKEIQYTLFDNTGVALFLSGIARQEPAAGIVYNKIARCNSCGAPLLLSVPDIRTNTATARWRPATRGFQPTYAVQWDTMGFAYGRGRNRLTTTDTFAVITGLTEFVKYDVYVATICAGNDSSIVAGPASFKTDTATDLSVSRILGPGNSCSLGVDSIKILIKNIGGVPQQLFQYKASVNGQLLPISVPSDGLFTGVLSKDSTIAIAFKTLYDFSPIGEYVIKAWTAASDDKFPLNDTATLIVTHPRTIGTFPYYQDFELGKDTWFLADTVGNSTWQYAQPRGQIFTSAASGVRAWTTWADSSYRPNEFAYVNSPCLNFTAFTADPRISLNVNAHSEAGFDGSWMESSVDNGLSWQVVGGRRTGVNWYNDSIAQVSRPSWGGTADSTRGWRLAQNILRGTAGKSNVRLRIAFRSDNLLNSGDGFAFDNVLISALPVVDFASTSNISNASVNPCGDSVVNTLTFRVANLGSTAQRNFALNYQINGGATVSEALDSLIQPNQTVIYASKKPFRTTAVGNYAVKSWVSIAGDAQSLNDSLSTTFRITLEKPILVSAFPYLQDFENGSGTWSATDSLNGTWGLVTPTGSGINSASSGSKVFKVGATPTNAYNNSEWSYLLSPCFDFTSMTADPRIGFALNVQAEKLGTTTYDGAWLEGSTDGGKVWTRLGTRNTGVNWYTDSINSIRRGVWSGLTPGWKYAQNILTGFAGKPNCRFRFVFRSDISGNSTGGVPYGGVAVDDIFIGEQAPIDLASGGGRRVDLTTCGRLNDTVSMNITNVGTTRQFRFSANYQIDNQAAVTELVDSLNILPNQTAVYKFKTAYNSAVLGNHTLTTWVSAVVGDVTKSNDTLRLSYVIPPAISAFRSYNFDDGVAPQYWTAIGAIGLELGGHGNAATNGYIFTNVYNTNNRVELTTHRFGPVRSDKDSVSFDYRFVAYDAPNGAFTFLPANKDTFNFQVAYDCEPNFVTLETITAANHVATTAYQTRKFSLGAFKDRAVRFRFRMVTSATGSADYYADIDNINFITCPENFGIQAKIGNSRLGSSIGSIALRAPTAGLAPYSYNWSNGRTTDSIGGLAAGTYTVTITDGRGCTQSGVYTVQNTVGTFDLSSIFSKVTLAPNPTTGATTLNLELSRPTSARIQVLNVMGQLLYETRSQTSEQQQQYELDMTDRPAGVYLVRIVADNRSFVAKLVKQ